ncbi:hypothetical protein BDZ89DRAFT_543444 [Hymenopellis radicata]|nr:hypothetical protein BDZ89DRAFT_543444 [Hymenopellis radicata]
MVTATPISLGGPGAKPCLLFRMATQARRILLSQPIHGAPSSGRSSLLSWNMEMTAAMAYWWCLGSHYFYAVACAVVVLARSYVVLRR